MYSVSAFKKRLDEQVAEIKTSSLKDTNEEFYTSLLVKARDLNLSLINQDNKDEKLTRSLAEIGALFEFYMWEWGNKDAALLHAKAINENLVALAEKLNESNYLEIEKEFEDILKLYEDIIKRGDDDHLKDIIANFRYQIFRYKLLLHIIDDHLPVNTLLVYLVQDIDAILSDAEVSSAIKYELKKYAFDVDLIKVNFKKVAALVNLGLHYKKAVEKEVEEELGCEYINESDTTKVFYEPLDKNENAIFFSYNFDGVIENVSGDVSENVFNYFISNLESGYNLDYQSVVTSLISHDFKGVRYLIEGLIEHGYKRQALDLHFAFLNYGDKSYLSKIEEAMISYRDDLSRGILLDYIIKSHSSFLINYLFISKRYEDLESIFGELSISMQKRLLDKRLEIAQSENEKESILISYLVNKDSKIHEYTFQKILESQDAKFVISALDALIESFKDSQENLRKTFFGLINLISDEKIKKQVLDYYYSITSNLDNAHLGLLIKPIIQCKEALKDYLRPEQVESLNILEAYQYSEVVSKRNILPFLKKYYKENLNWSSLIDRFYYEDNTFFFPVIMYCYLGNREYFINNVDLRYRGLISYLLEQVPGSIADLLVALSPLQIARLDDDILELFAKAYENKLKQENICLNDQMDLIISGRSKPSDTVEFLTYVMHRGLLNEPIMYNFSEELFSKENFAQISSGSPIMIKALQNSEKYRRAGLVLIALNNYSFMPLAPEILEKGQVTGAIAEDFNFDIIFMSEKELMGLRANAQISKLEMYYESLIRLLSLVPDSVQKRIIMQIARSKNENYIRNIIDIFPELTDFILNQIDDIYIYNKLKCEMPNAGLPR